jgi:hypothetical protein
MTVIVEVVAVWWLLSKTMSVLLNLCREVFITETMQTARVQSSSLSSANVAQAAKVSINPHQEVFAKHRRWSFT